MNFTMDEQVVLYQINNMRFDEHTPTRAEVEAIVDKSVMQSLVERGDISFDVDGNLAYAPYPRRS